LGRVALLALYAQQYVHFDLYWDNAVVRDGTTAEDPPLAVVCDCFRAYSRVCWGMSCGSSVRGLSTKRVPRIAHHASRVH
jgi:hypothetical protein